MLWYCTFCFYFYSGLLFVFGVGHSGGWQYCQHFGLDHVLLGDAVGDVALPLGQELHPPQTGVLLHALPNVAVDDDALHLGLELYPPQTGDFVLALPRPGDDVALPP